jgi:hypothetical protein
MLEKCRMVRARVLLLPVAYVFMQIKDEGKKSGYKCPKCAVYHYDQERTDKVFKTYKDIICHMYALRNPPYP